MRNLLLILLPILLTACSTMSSLDNTSREGKTLKVTNHSYDRVYKAAYEVLNNEFNIDSADKEKGVIKAYKSVSAFSWGEFISVAISPASAGAKSYSVKVISLRRVKTQITGGDLESSIVNKIEHRLRM